MPPNQISFPDPNDIDGSDTIASIMAPAPVPHFVVRPSVKLLVPHYVIAGLLFVAATVVYLKYETQTNLAIAMYVAAIVWAIATATRHLKRRFIALTLDGDRLRYEEGMLSRTTRSLNLNKIQDVRVQQSVGQRLLSIGSLTIETAGETGQLTMENIDNPQYVADHILALSRQQGGNA